MKDVPFLELLPENSLHRRVISTAIRAKDEAALLALKGQINKPIHYVTNWFFYELMMRDRSKDGIVIIWSPQARLDYAHFKSQQQSPQPVQMAALPVNTYDFLT